MMKAVRLACAFCLCCLMCYSQRPEGRIRDFKSENGIKSYWVYNLSCNYDIIVKGCSNKGPYYLFWKQSGVWNVKRFDCFENYHTVQIANPDSLDFYLRYFQREGTGTTAIKGDEPKNQKRKKQKNGTMPTGFICLHTIKFYTGRLPIERSANDYYLSSGKTDPEYDPDSYAGLKPLFLWADKIVKKLFEENRFIKTPSARSEE